MKALEKDRTRRYETANGLARDIQRYLADEPVEACPPSARYRLRKFARKHRAALATASAFAALLVAATAISTWQAVRAAKAKDEAVRAYAAEVEQRRQAQDCAPSRSRRASEAQAQARLLERLLYINLVALAQRENLANNVGYAEQLLDRCPRRSAAGSGGSSIGPTTASFSASAPVPGPTSCARCSTPAKTGSPAAAGTTSGSTTSPADGSCTT